MIVRKRLCNRFLCGAFLAFVWFGLLLLSLLLYKVSINSWMIVPEMRNKVRSVTAASCYGTARFKLEARVRVTRAYFVTPLEYFSKSCVSVDNCTRISRAIHARVKSPNMLAYVRAWTHVTMHAHSLRNFDRHQ